MLLHNDSIEFPSKYLNCYEAALITALKYMGLFEETVLMGTQAYFVFFEDADFHISPRFNSLDEEWERIHGLTVEDSPVVNDIDLSNKIASRINSGIPACLLVDIYFMPHTPHYGQLHQNHYIDIFGYDHDHYYMVCPYYRFMDWIDAELIHTSFFSPALNRRRLFAVPKLRLRTLFPERVLGLVRESCQNMLGLTIPKLLTHADPQTLGLTGILTFSCYLQSLVAGQRGELPRELLLNLSWQAMSLGYSRYWFQRLIQSFQAELLSADAVPVLEKQFADVIQAWRAIGIRLSAGAYGNRPEMVEHTAGQLRQIYELERRLFNNLLGSLTGYESDRL